MHFSVYTEKRIDPYGKASSKSSVITGQKRHLSVDERPKQRKENG